VSIQPFVVVGLATAAVAMTSVAWYHFESAPAPVAAPVPGYVQMAPLEVPTQPVVGPRRAGVMTVLFAVADTKQASEVCHYVPRIRDAYLMMLAAEPVPLNSLFQMQTAVVRPRLLDAAQRAVGGSTIAGVTLYEGAVVFDSEKGPPVVTCGTLQASRRER